jgi:hypothetical protein
VPLLLGIAAGGPAPGHLLLGIAAVAAYLFSVPALEWIRTRRPEHLPPAGLFGLVLAGAGVPLLVTYPDIALFVAGALAAGAATVVVVLAGRATSVAVSLLQVAQAIFLVPAAATISGTLGDASTWRAALVGGIYLVGSVLVVRSMIRARGDRRFLAASMAFHGGAVVLAAGLLPWPYAVLAAGLLARAVALPLLQSRLAAGPRRLRPIHIGMVEIVASVALVLLAFGIGL